MEHELPLMTIFIRIGAALLVGLLIGIDRNWKKKPVDFKAYVIVSVASTITAILCLSMGEEFARTHPGAALDPMRAVQGVLMGIGFLGAGVIIKHAKDDRVVGTATAASIWATGALGLVIGFGYFKLAAIGFGAIFFTLLALGFLVPDTEESCQDKK